MDRQTTLMIIIAFSAVAGLFLEIYTEFVWMATVLSGLYYFFVSERAALLILGFAIGWLAQGRYKTEEAAQPREVTEQEPNSVDKVDEIHGCVEKEGVAWRGVVKLQNSEIKELEVPYEPICPECQTKMNDDSNSYSVGSPTYGVGHRKQTNYIWSCPTSSCGHITNRKYSLYENAKNILDRHLRRITESEGEEYSLENLIEEIDGEPTPKAIWCQYAEVVDDSDISTNCFH